MYSEAADVINRLSLIKTWLVKISHIWLRHFVQLLLFSEFQPFQLHLCSIYPSIICFSSILQQAPLL